MKRCPACDKPKSVGAARFDYFCDACNRFWLDRGTPALVRRARRFERARQRRGK